MRRSCHRRASPSVVWPGSGGLSSTARCPSGRVTRIGFTQAVLAWKREGYSRTSFSLRDTASMLAFPGFWRMAPHYAGIGLAEYRRAWSRGLFVRSLQRLVPEIAECHVRPAGCGVRAQAMDRSGKLLDDFAFAESARQLHVVNAPSPAATASLAIGAFIARKVLAQA